MLSFVREHRLALLLIAAYALMAHMLLLLNDLPYWDGWYYFFYVENNEAEAVLREWRDNGRILLGQMYWHLGRLLGTLTGFRALMVGCIAIASMLLYALLLRHARLTRTECLAAALLNCSFPATQVNLVSTAFPYTLAMPFFLGGTLLLMESAGCSGRRKLLLRIAANACLLASYISEAYVLAGLPLPLLVWAKAPQGGLRGILRTYRKHADILLGSLSYLYVMMFLMPVSGHYAHSRNLSLNPASLTSYYLAYIGTTLDIANMFSPLPTKLHRDVNLLLAIAIVVIGLLLRKKFADKQGKHYATVALLSFLLLSAIATPFVTAQRATATMGWDIRHVAPAGFAAAIIVVCAVGYFLRAPGGSRRVLYAMAALSGLAISKDYVMWQTRGAYDHGVIEHLRVDHPIMKQPVIFFVGWNNFFFREVYRHYEWERMMEGATGTRGRRVIMAQPPLTQAIWDEKIQQDLWPGESLKVSPQSCQMIFQPIATPENIRWGAGLEYLWKKYTLTPEMLANWAKSRVTIQMNVVANCDAVINPEPLRTPDEQHRKKLSR